VLLIDRNLEGAEIGFSTLSSDSQEVSRGFSCSDQWKNRHSQNMTGQELEYLVLSAAQMLTQYSCKILGKRLPFSEPQFFHP
jgi:hypothetical protein